jgi:ADP-ribose pyrophosphatase
MTNDYATIHSEEIYQGRVFTVRRDEVRLPDGEPAQLDIIVHRGAATLVPLDAQGHIWFVRQYRHAAGESLFELPAGTIDPGESAEACAAREVREEIGMAAGSLKHIGEFFLAPGYSTEFMRVFLATGLTPDSRPHDDDEFLEVARVPVAEAYAMALDGRIRDGKSLAALLLARPHLEAMLADPSDSRGLPS